jgi:isopentenyl diphosphate isomerase/L-lactate dehydrogenase-like FMN-dependent dehydrogenase
MPILVAPTAMHRYAHAEGECATARCAGAAGTLMTVSTESTCSLEEIAAAATGPLWFQLYVFDRANAESLVRRAEDAGYRALVLTVDSPRWGSKQRAARSEAEAPQFRAGNFAEGADLPAVSLTWEAVAWLKSITPLPVLLKGILTAEDAALAVQHGADGLIVSNHGGRQLDGLPATIEALPAITAAVGSRLEVLIDGGIRRGSDLVKARALGARACMVGRPWLYGLAADGERGVQTALELLTAELDRTLALVGVPRFDDVDASVLFDPAPVALPPRMDGAPGA